MDKALTLLRDRATNLLNMDRFFERLMQVVLSRATCILGDRFQRVWLRHEWPDREGPDTGFDLVVEEREGGLCAIQHEFFDPHWPVPSGPLTRFERSRCQLSTSRA